MALTVPWRRSLLVRLLAAFALVALGSIAATAWLAVQTTTVAIQQEQGQALADDARIYDTLLGYAATHPNWDGVAPTVTDLARRTGRRVALTTSDHRPIADSAAGALPLPTNASAVVDPLAVDPALVPGAADDRIDPRAVGPYLLPADERAQLSAAAIQAASCIRIRHGLNTRVVDGPSGRPAIEGLDALNGMTDSCVGSAFTAATATEAKASVQLNALLNACLARQGVPSPNNNRAWPQPPNRSVGLDARAWACLTIARHEQLAPYVSPASLLFVTSAGGSTPGFDLSSANRAKIVGASTVIALLTLAISVLAGTQLVRPLRALTVATQRMRDGAIPATVRVSSRDEVGQLAATFNDMSAGRARLEQLRKALVNDVAHELRTPVSNIRAWLEAVEDGLTVPDGPWVSSLLEEALLLQRIIDDLQDLAMADAGTLRLHRERIRLADLLTQVATAHGAMAATAGVDLRVRVDGEPELDADPVRLRQAVGNLVANALRHTPVGGSVVMNASQAHGFALIDVVDTGAGIAAMDLPHVFDRFWRAEKSRNRQSGGSGLGLAIVRKLAEAHGGSVEVVSTVDRGSTFTLRLPAHQPDSPAGHA